MANVIINDTHLTDIANAIRVKNGTGTTYKPSEMANAIKAIPQSGSTTTSTLWETGTWDEINEVLTSYYNGESINLRDYFAVGQKRSININALEASNVMDAQDAVSVVFTIIGIGHDDLTTATDAGVTKAALTVQTEYMFPTKMKLDTTSYSSTNTSIQWEDLDIRKFFNNAFKAAFECADYIKQVHKKQSYSLYSTVSTFGSTYILKETDDYIFLLSQYEVAGNVYKTEMKQDGERYEYFANDVKNKFKYVEGNEFPTHHKTRSVYFMRNSSSSMGGTVISISGTAIATYTISSAATEVAPAFCL